LADLQRTVYPGSGHLSSSNPSAGQGKFASQGRRSTHYAMVPTANLVN